MSKAKRTKASKPATPKRKLFEGVVEVCCHRVPFWYDVTGYELTDELQERLTEEAEERAQASIIEGYRSGELNCYYVFPDETEGEIRGWWDIDRS